MALVRTWMDCDEKHVESALPKELRELYDGDLHFRESRLARPFVIANFVSTLDGVASYAIKGNPAAQPSVVPIRRTGSSWVCCGPLRMPSW